MAPKRDDAPALILRSTPRGLVPAAAIDQETLASFRFDTEFEAHAINVRPSPALRAWWGLLNAVVKHEPQYGSGRALSNSILLKWDLVETEALIGGGKRLTPMSLKDFSDEQLWNLIEQAKLLITTEIIPGVEIDELFPRKMRG